MQELNIGQRRALRRTSPRVRGCSRGA